MTNAKGYLEWLEQKEIMKNKRITNDEWRKTCSAEEFAEWIEDVAMWAAKEQGCFTVKGWEKWLKEEHEQVAE